MTIPTSVWGAHCAAPKCWSKYTTIHYLPRCSYHLLYLYKPAFWAWPGSKSKTASHCKISRRLFNSDFISYNGLQSNTWQKFVMLPRAVQSHCMLTLNSTTLIMIGGRTHTGPIRETVLYDLVN